MEHIKTFETFDNYEGYEDLQIDEGLISDFKKGVERKLGKLAGEISIEDAKEIAEKRYSSQIKNAKKFDSDPEKVKRAKEEQGDNYMSAEDSVYKAISLEKDVKMSWDQNLGIYRNQKRYGVDIPGGK